MRMKSTLLSTAAGAMAALVLVATPALSQSSDGSAYSDSSGSYRPGDSGPQYSTPAEHARTEQLNSSARDGLYTSPAVLNGEEDGGLSRARATTDERSEAYQQNLRNYHRQLHDYHEQRIDYREAIQRYDRGEWRFDNYPENIRYDYDDDGIRPVSFMTNAGPRLYLASVRGPDGWVGKVRGVRLTSDGRPVSVEVALDRRFAVWVSPQHLRFDPRSRVVFTDLSQNDLWEMPGVYVNTVAYR